MGQETNNKFITACQRIALCVEDDTQIRSLIGMILRREGFSVIEATTGGAADEILKRGAPSLVVLEVDLPDGNGFDLAQNWRNRHPKPFPILFISGGENSSCRPRAEALAAGFLAKPFNHLALLSAIESLLTLS